MKDHKFQLVFVNPEENYCFHGLSGISTNGYLWLVLHENNYDCVYFLSYVQNTISVTDYGDMNCQRFVRNRKKLMKSSENESDSFVTDVNPQEFKSLILPEFDKKASAIVIPFEAFIRMLSDKHLNSAFSAFLKTSQKKGRATIYLICNSEDDLLIRDDRVYAFLDKSVVDIISNKNFQKEETVRDMLYSGKSDNCFFIDRLSRDDVKDLLFCLLSESKECFNSTVDLKCLTDYLCVVTDEATPVDESFGLKYKIRSRSEAYDILANKGGWKRLCNNSRFMSIKFLSLADSFAPYLERMRVWDEGIEAKIDRYQKQISVYCKNENDACLNYCIMMICRLFRQNDFIDDYITKVWMIQALNVFVWLSTLGDLDRRYIAGEYFNKYLECFYSSNQIFRQLNAYEGSVVLDSNTESIISSLRNKMLIVRDNMNSLSEEALSMNRVVTVKAVDSKKKSKKHSEDDYSIFDIDM